VAPGPVERAAIWQLHLPSEHRLSQSFLDEVSLRCSVTGGQIRNAALAATLLALRDGTPMKDHHLLDAIEGEFRKAHAMSPFNDDAPTVIARGGVDAFVARLVGS
jgi:hypothetical protein